MYDFNENLLSRLLIDGDESALKMIEAVLAEPLSKMLRRRFVPPISPDEISDVVQEVLLQVWTDRSEFDAHRGGVLGWCFNLCKQVAWRWQKQGWLRQRCRECDVSVERLDRLAPANDANLQGDCGSVYLSVIRNEVRLALATLPQQERKVLWADACSPDGCCNSTILARELGISPSTVRTYRQRGRARLKTLLAQEGHAHPRSNGASTHDWLAFQLDSSDSIRRIFRFAWNRAHNCVDASPQ